MLTFPTLRLAALLTLTSLGAASCISPPDYPDTPQIEFVSITQDIRVNDLGPFNNVGIRISYKDGDGNLGMYQEEIDKATTDPSNLDNYNFICYLQTRNGSNDFVDYNFSSVGYSSQFPYLPPAEQGDRKAPLRGELTLDVPITASPPALPVGAVIRFRVKIKDRDRNESNEVFTAPITIK